MHLSAHTWMRPEPLEQTLHRLSRLGYTSIELSGEPSLHPIHETRLLLEKYKITCWGAVTIQQGDRDLLASDPQQRRDTIQYMKDVVSMSAELGGQIVTVVPSKVGKIIPSSTPEIEWKWAIEGLREVAEFAQHRKVKIALEPLNRFETYFLNRSDQALTLANEVGFSCGIAFDVFHLALEEKDMIAAIRTCGSRIFDVHVADNNRLAPGDGCFDWAEIISVLSEVGYEGALAVEFMPPIDRTPVGKYGTNQLEADFIDVPPGQLQFIIDHGSGLLSDSYYTALLTRSAQTLQPFVASE
ncbi:Fc.00g010910.m01.CDS01 [Cosmosporella sp. VM-42]